MALNYLEGLFIDAPSRSSFNNLLTLGRVRNDLIAFIKDTNEIWTQGHFYNCNGSTVSDIINVVKNNFSQITPEIEQVIQNKVASWALKNNTDTIPLNKLPQIPDSKLPSKLVITGYLRNERFYVNDELVDGKSGNLYIDIETKEIYIWRNALYEKISASGGDTPSLNLATIATTGLLSDGIEDLNHRLVTDTEKAIWNGKLDIISDLATIRANAIVGAAKISNVKANWAETDPNSLAFILGKPVLANRIVLNDDDENPIELDNTGKFDLNVPTSVVINKFENGLYLEVEKEVNEDGKIDLTDLVNRVVINDNSLTTNNGTIDLSTSLSTLLNTYALKSQIPSVGNGQINLVYLSPVTEFNPSNPTLGTFKVNQTGSTTINLKGIFDYVTNSIMNVINLKLVPAITELLNKVDTLWNIHFPNLNIFYWGPAGVDDSQYRSSLIYDLEDIPLDNIIIYDPTVGNNRGKKFLMYIPNKINEGESNELSLPTTNKVTIKDPNNYSVAYTATQIDTAYTKILTDGPVYGQLLVTINYQ